MLPHEGRGPRADEGIAAADPALDIPPDAPDMIVGEVKTGRAEINRGATDPSVLRSVLLRSGCCDHRAIEAIVGALLRRGEALTLDGHHLRLVAFGALPPEHRTPRRVVLLRDVAAFPRGYVRLHWTVLRHVECKDPAFNFLMMLEKAAGAPPL